MSQASQRVSKLSRRARPAPAPADELPDLDTSDDFTSSLSFARSRSWSALSQSSCAAEPSSSQFQRLSAKINPLRAKSVSFCGVLDGSVVRSAARTRHQTTGGQGPSDSVQDQDGDIRQRLDAAGPRPSGGRIRRATRAAANSSRPSRSTRRSAAAAGLREAPPPAPPPAVDLSRFARSVEAVSKPASPPPSGSAGVPVVPPVGPTAAIADCPVCLQPLPSAAARAAHLKLCGERRGLSLAQLLAAVRLQRKQAGEREAAGLPPTRAAPPAAAVRRPPTALLSWAGAAGDVAGDADLQMALAVSASLRDEQERTRRAAESQLLELGLGDEVEAARDGGAPAVPPEPEAPAPAPAPSADGPPVGRSRGGRRGRRKAATSVLLSQTREERERRLSEKGEDLPVEGRRLRTRVGSRQPAPAWEKAAQLHTNEGDYYVPELVGLVEPCTAPITSMLKDVADIPGRGNLTQASGEDPGSGGEAEEADATQAALLLLAGDSDSQSSQPAACPDTESSQLAAGAPSGPAAARGELQVALPAPTGDDLVSEVPKVDMAQWDRTDEAQGKTIGNEASGGRLSQSRSPAAGSVCDDGAGITSAVDRLQTPLPGGRPSRAEEETYLSPPSQISGSGGRGAPYSFAESFDGALGGAQASSVVSSRRRVPSTPGSEGGCPGPGCAEAAGPEGGACFSAGEGDLGAALLELLLTGGGPAAASLLCRDGPVAVHPAVLAARCPPLYGAVAEAGGRLPLPEVGCHAAAALVRLLYLGETRCSADGGPMPQLLLLADRFGLVRLARHLREDHGVAEPAAEPPAPAPLSPELFDLAEPDGTPAMELGSPAGGAPQPPGSGRRHSPRRGSSDNGIVCTPGQSEERGDDRMEMTHSGLSSSPALAEGMPRRTEKTSLEDSRAPIGHVTPASVGEPPSGAGDAKGATPSTPRRSRKRSTVTPHRPDSSDGGCEVFSSLPKRRRTASPAGRTEWSGSTARRAERSGSTAGRTERSGSPAGRTERSGSPAGRTERSGSPAGRTGRSGSPAGRTERSGSPDGRTGRSGSPAGRTERSGSPASPELQSALPGSRRLQSPSPVSQKPAGEPQGRRPGSADSDVEVLDEMPSVFTQHLKSPRRSARRGEDATSPVAASKRTPGRVGEDAQSEVSPAKTPSAAAGCPAKSPAEDVFFSSSLSLPQSQRRQRSGCADGSLASSPVISKRREQDDEVRDQPSSPPSDHRESGADEAISPVRSQRPSTPGGPMMDGDVSAASLPPCSPELPIVSPPRPTEAASPGSSSPESGRRSVGLPPPGDRPVGPVGGRSGGLSPDPPPNPSPLPLDDVWDGFEDGGYIELIEPPLPLDSSLGPGPGRSSTPAAPAAAPRSSLDSSELWQDSSLLAGFTTPTAAERTTNSRRVDTGSPSVRSSDTGSPIVRREDTRSPRVRSSDTVASRVRSSDIGSSTVCREDTGSPGIRQQDSGTPEARMPPPQRTPVNNPYRVALRDSSTPMPNYVLMLTPELKRELARIGVKPIARRKAVALLSHIYEETHPPVSAADGSDRSGSSRTVRSAGAASPAAVSSAGRPRLFCDPGGCPAGRSAGSGCQSSAGQPGWLAGGPAGGDRPAPPPEPTPSREPLRRSGSDSDSDSDSDAESSGSEGAAARLEEVFGRLGERLEREEEDEEATPSQAACAASLPEVLRSFIQSRPEIYHQVLTYEPIWLERLHRDLRQTGVKLNVSQLMDFLDQQCITFRTENSGRRQKSPKKKRSSKKTSPKKRGPSQKKKSPQKRVE